MFLYFESIGLSEIICYNTKFLTLAKNKPISTYPKKKNDIQLTNTFYLFIK